MMSASQTVDADYNGCDMPMGKTIPMHVVLDIENAIIGNFDSGAFLKEFKVCNPISFS